MKGPTAALGRVFAASARNLQSKDYFFRLTRNPREGARRSVDHWLKADLKHDCMRVTGKGSDLALLRQGSPFYVAGRNRNARRLDHLVTGHSNSWSTCNPLPALFLRE